MNRAQEADARRREADLMAELAQTLLGRPNLDAELPVAAERIATALELPSAALQLDEAPDHPGRIALPLTQNDRRIGTLVVPAGIDSDSLSRRPARTRRGLSVQCLSLRPCRRCNPR